MCGWSLGHRARALESGAGYLGNQLQAAPWGRAAQCHPKGSSTAGFGAERRPWAGPIPSFCPRPCCVAHRHLWLFKHCDFPPHFPLGKEFTFSFYRWKKKMRHRLRWQGKGHRKISFLWGACLKYRLIAWESQRAGCSTGSGRALVPPKCSCRTHRDS